MISKEELISGRSVALLSQFEQFEWSCISTLVNAQYNMVVLYISYLEIIWSLE